MQTLSPGILLHNNTYRIERVLGQGGFGITYLAVHVRLKKRVAIKEFFPNSLCDRAADTVHVITSSRANSVKVDKLRKKFIKEAAHIAEMDSPYIVKIADVFEENDTAYYIMDYIEGQSLSDIVKSCGSLPVEQAVEYIRKIGEALSYIHSKRMNHLDVKPANIMIRSKDNTPILIDFGLSKQYDSEGNQTSTTPVGISHGYAPMEQYNDGGVKEFSPQTDLYSLAATLYYLLTGVVPPPAPRILVENFSFSARFPQWLQPIIRQAMSPNRTNRQDNIMIFCKQLTGRVPSDEETRYDLNKDTNTKNQQKSDRKFYETDESYAHLKQLKSPSEENREGFISYSLKKIIVCLTICIILLGIVFWVGIMPNNISSKKGQIERYQDNYPYEKIINPKDKYEIGDFIQTETGSGIVFNIDSNGNHGLIVSLKGIKRRWANKNSYLRGIRCVDSRDGYNNMQFIKKITDWENKFPAFHFCDSIGKGWYLPAQNELDDLLRSAYVINSSLNLVGGMPISQGIHWSSTATWVSSLDSECIYQQGYSQRGWEDDAIFDEIVRPIAKF